MAEKSASISQQRLMGMAWAIRKGKLDPNTISDKDFREKLLKIANSDNFKDETLHKMASTKYRGDNKKLMPYKIGKGTVENPERKRRPYKKKLQEILDFDRFLKFQEFLEGYYLEGIVGLGNSQDDLSGLLQAFLLIENLSLNPGMNIPGMGPVDMPGNPGTSTSFHNQDAGSGDMPAKPAKATKKKKKKKKKKFELIESYDNYLKHI